VLEKTARMSWREIWEKELRVRFTSPGKPHQAPKKRTRAERQAEGAQARAAQPEMRCRFPQLSTAGRMLRLETGRVFHLPNLASFERPKCGKRPVLLGPAHFRGLAKLVIPQCFQAVDNSSAVKAVAEAYQISIQREWPSAFHWRSSKNEAASVASAGGKRGPKTKGSALLN
jgi:hypothetical protein